MPTNKILVDYLIDGKLSVNNVTNQTGSILTLSSVDGKTITKRTPAEILADIGGLPASSYTAADVLSKLLTVDGASSGLDADLLDGQQGSYYLNAGNLTGTLADARLSSNVALKNVNNNFSIQQFIQAGNSTTQTHFLELRPTDYGVGKPSLYFKKEATATNWTIGLFDGSATIGSLELRATTLTKEGNVIWHAGNSNLSTINWAAQNLTLNGTLTGATTGNFSTSVTSPSFIGNASTATKLQTARTISLSGGAVGSTTFDGSANSAISVTQLAPEYIQPGYLGVNGGIGLYLNTHPENSGTILPFINNDLAFLTLRGGAMTSYTTSDVDYTQKILTNTGAVSLSTTAPFDGSASYAQFTVAATSNVVIIDINTPQIYPYGTQFYIDFGAANWRAKDITFLAYNSDANNSETVYKPVGSVTNHSRGSFYNLSSYSYVNNSAVTVQGFNRLRIVLTNFNTTTPRIACIGVINYASSGLRETFVSRGGSSIYGNLDPNVDGSLNLGSSSNYWNVVYSKRFFSNIATGTSPLSVSSTTLNTNLNADMVDGVHESQIVWGNTISATNNGRVDINTLTKSGFYFAGSGSTSSPDAMPQNGRLLVLGYDSTANIYRGNLLLTDSGDFYYRVESGTNNSWSNWRKSLDSVNYGAYSTFTGVVQGTRLISTIATGTAPLTVASTTVVTNLNADLLDGQNGSYYLDLVNHKNIISDFNTPNSYKIIQATAATTTNQPAAGAWGQGIQFSTNNDPAYANQLVFSSTGNLYTRSKSGGAYGAWQQIWTSTTLTNLNQLTTRNFSDLQSKPTTLAGYGITDALQNQNVSAQTANAWINGTGRFDGGVQTGNNANTASSSNVGMIRYRSDANNSYIDMSMQTGASTYEWVNVLTNSW